MNVKCLIAAISSCLLFSTQAANAYDRDGSQAGTRVQPDNKILSLPNARFLNDFQRQKSSQAYRIAQEIQTNSVEESAGPDAQTGHETWVADKSGCLIWSATAESTGTPFWSGDCVDGKAQGEGVLNWVYSSDGNLSTSTFVGSMDKGKRHGTGTFTDTNAKTVEGNWVEDVMVSVAPPNKPEIETVSDETTAVSDTPPVISEQDIRDVQLALNDLGYRHGEVTGVLDDETSLGIWFYNMDWGISFSDELTPELVSRLRKEIPETKDQFLASNRPDCAVWGTPLPKLEISWTGSCVDGKASGKGNLTLNFTRTSQTKTLEFEGNLVAGEIYGAGTLKRPNGEIYEGDLVKGASHGEGKLTYADGRTYEGGFFKGREHGAGVLEYPDQYRYEGEFEKGVKSGTGEMTWTDGSRYTGAFLNDKRTGQGEFFWTNGDRYKGDFENGFRTGQGEFHSADGDVYKGEFLVGARTGKGLLTRTNGNRYEGDFVDGKFHGVGEFTWADGEKYAGDFANNSRNGKGVYTWLNGNQYEGDFVDGDRTGTGTFTWPNGDRYEGDFLNGSRTGSGVYTWSDGEKYAGGMIDGERHGLGVYVSADGDRNLAVWRYGNQVNGMPEPKEVRSQIDQSSSEPQGTDAPIKASKFQIRLVQQQLNGRNYNAGPVDGVMGPKTANAIRIFRSDWQLPDSSEISDYLIKMLMRRTVKTEFRSIQTDRPDCHIRYWPEPLSEATWTGDCQNGFANGTGKLLFSYIFGGHRVEETYDGEMQDGMFNGLGINTFPDGAWYEGEFLEGKRNGAGYLRFTDGGQYEGTFSNGKRDGFGLLLWTNGNQHQGEFKNDQITGYGVRLFKDGLRVEGEFSPEGIKHGMVRYHNGNRYYGDLKDAAWHGSGLYVQHDGSMNEGTWHNGKLKKNHHTGIETTTSKIPGHILSENYLENISLFLDRTYGFKLCLSGSNSCSWVDEDHRVSLLYLEKNRVRGYVPSNEDSTRFDRILDQPLNVWVERDPGDSYRYSVFGNNLIVEFKNAETGYQRWTHTVMKYDCAFYFEYNDEDSYSKEVNSKCNFSFESGNSFE